MEQQLRAPVPAPAQSRSWRYKRRTAPMFLPGRHPKGLGCFRYDTPKDRTSPSGSVGRRPAACLCALRCHRSTLSSSAEHRAGTRSRRQDAPALPFLSVFVSAWFMSRWWCSWLACHSVCCETMRRAYAFAPYRLEGPRKRRAAAEKGTIKKTARKTENAYASRRCRQIQGRPVASFVDMFHSRSMACATDSKSIAKRTQRRGLDQATPEPATQGPLERQAPASAVDRCCCDALVLQLLEFER